MTHTFFMHDDVTLSGSRVSGGFRQDDQESVTGRNLALQGRNGEGKQPQRHPPDVTQPEVQADDPEQPLVLRGKGVLLELKEAYRDHRPDGDGMRGTHEQHRRLPFFLWVRRVHFDIDRTVLRLGSTVAVVLLLAMMRAPWWSYTVWAIIMIATAPFYLTAPRVIVIDKPTPEQRSRWQRP